jgi:hypothetical protein
VGSGVDEGDDVPAQAVADTLDGIAGQHLQRLEAAAFGLAGFGPS